MTPARRDRGFTLISVMVALVVVSVGLLALARAQASMVASQGNTANRTVGVTIARDYAEVLRARDPRTLVSEPAIRVDREGVPSGTGAYTRTTNVTVLAPNLLQVQVLVAYPRGGAPVEILTLIYRPTT
jgi:prepilin-type N-terminal cleavage/methylation domain-containing protein